MGEAIAVRRFEKFFPEEPKPTSTEMFSWLPVRYSVALYALAMNWVAAGGHSSAKPETLRNDGIDMFYIAYVTAFDGVISEDHKLLVAFETVSAVLK